MYKLELNDQEATVLNQLLDLAVKAQGLQVAESALYLAKKIQTGKVVEEIKIEEVKKDG